MPLRVNNNISAINVQRSINRTTTELTRQLERLSTGMRVNRASDDASGLAVSEGMRSELAGLGQNVRNAEQAFNMLQVAEGSLQEVNNILVRMRELTVQGASSTLNNSNRESVAAEFNQLRLEVDRIAQATTYNGEALLTGFGSRVDSTSTALTESSTTGVVNISLAAVQSGTYTFEGNSDDGLLTLGNGTVTQTLNTGILLDGNKVESGATAVANFDRLGIQVTLAGAGASGATGDYVDGELDDATIVVQEGTGGIFQVGPRADVVYRIEVGIADLRATGNSLNLANLALNSRTGARDAMALLDQAVNTVANERGKLGAVQNRLLFSIAYSENEIESIQASESSIRDADVAHEVSRFSRAQILLQSSNAMLVQSNVTSVQALTLL